MARTLYPWLLGVALVAVGCGEQAPAPAATPGDTAAAGAAGPDAAATPEGAGETAPAPAGAADASDPMSWARSSVSHGYLVVPSLERLLKRSKAIAKAAVPDGPAAEIDNIEKELVQSMDLPPGALDLVDQTRPLVLMLVDPSKEDKDPPMVAVIPVKDAEQFRQILTAPPAVPEGMPEEMAKDWVAERQLTIHEAGEGRWRYSRMEEHFDYEAYDAACEAARKAGKEEPEFDEFNVKKETDKIWLSVQEGLVLLAPAEKPLQALLDAELPAAAVAAPTDDAAIWVDAARLRERFRAEVDDGMEEMRREMGRETRGAPKFAGEMVDDMADGFEAVVRQAAHGEVRVTLEPAVRVSFGAAFPADQSVGQALAEQLNDSADLAGLLPTESQIVMTSRLRYTEGMRKYFNRMFKGFMGEVRNEADRADAKVMLDRWEGILERLYGSMTGEVAAGMGLHRENGLWMVEVLRVTDETKARAATREYLASAKELVETFLKELPEEIAIEFDVREEVAKHRDVVLDRADVRFALAEGVPAGQLVRDVLQRLFGGPTMQAFSAVVKGHMVITFGAGAEARAQQTIDLILDGKQAGPGGDWPAVSQTIGANPTFVFYMAPLSLADEGINLAAVMQAGGCLKFQATVEKAAAAYNTINGAWPRDVQTLMRQQLLDPSGDVGCSSRYQLDPNTGKCRCALHGTVQAPTVLENAGDALGFPWDAPTAPGGFAYYGTVTRQGDLIGVEAGVAMPASTIGAMSKAIQPIMGAMGGRGGRVPNVAEGLSPQERQVVHNLKQVVAAQYQFQESAAVDQDGDGLGEFGFFGELAGTENLRGRTEMLNPALLSPIMGQKDANGVVVVGGYCYRIFLPAGESDDPMGEPSKAMGEPMNGVANLAKAGHADPQETRFVCYAWPVERGGTSMRTFVITQDSMVYSTDGMLTPYSGAASGPAAHAALDREGMDPGNLWGEVGSPAAGTRSVDGNNWQPIG